MTKYLLSICLAAALCYLVEGATQSDLQGAISRSGAFVRRDAIRNIGEAAGPGLADPVKRACVQVAVNLAHRDLNLAIKRAENQLRLESSTRTDEELAPLAVPELDNEARERIQSAVDGNIQSHLDAIRQC